MDLEDLREPSLNELCSLSILANVAYAVRCAQRMRPRFRLEDEPDIARMIAVLDGAIRWTHEYLDQGTGDLAEAERLVRLTSALAEATGEDTDYAAYSAHHAVRGALTAARVGEACDQEMFLEIVAAAYGSSRVLLSNVPTWIRANAAAALRADYLKLLELTMATATQRGQQMNATDAGPLGGLWQGSTPTW